MKRKSTAIVAALAAVALGAAACGSDSDGGGSSSGGSDGNYKLAFIQGVAGDAFYITMECGIKEEAAKEGATVDVQGAQKFDPTLQTPVLQSVIASKPDAILIAPTDVSAMQQPIAQAKAQGIKIVLVDTTLNDPSVAVSAIASDNSAGGKAAFEAIQKLVPNGGKVLGVGVQPGISTTDARDKGFEEAVKADPKFTYLGVQYSQNDPAKAASIVSAALQKDPDIVGIFASNLFSAQGSATGIRQAGKQGKVNVVGFDAGPEQIKALQDGTVQALIAQQPGDIGVQGVQQAIKALKGEANEANIKTGSTIITKDNLDSPEGQAAAYKASC
ncbi:ABC transporter substrate-binding protein [Asanoa sp. WMMD1127]|uniref:ABC transporter substrate-binding protein n=1 Tax=Asanoa sp. WMMD1127 TaxID=3016107 RepID=UPI002416C5E1|nr:ABC transporter substrate-binding protein [Asanoa sp. WMMD1127]MDG4825494.1 ABC transporter substrate-binding protein [Asanoa sp. WMMD1127]